MATTRPFFLGAVLGLAFSPAVAAEAAPRRPMAVRYEDTTTRRWLDKKVLETRLLDDMNDPATWQLVGKGEITFTKERVKEGAQSLHVRANVSGDGQRTVAGGSAFGTAGAMRVFNGEDWTHFNRVSFWAYPDFPGFYSGPIVIVLRNDGEKKSPASWNREGLNFLNLENHKWNHVVWEIAHLPRDKVTGLSIHFTLMGNEPEAEPLVTYDLNHLELQRVEADHYEGWNVAPGKISFSHTGYQLGSSKTAIASDLTARTFQLIREENGEIVVSKPVQTTKSPIGQFQVLDFSEVRQPGTYRIQADDVESRTFRIDVDVWRETILKTLNFFYAERCGMEIPGVHRVCHRDWQVVHGDKRIIVNGGWHDAGDLSQGPVNTSEAVYAMLSLAEKVRARGGDPELDGLLRDEAKWGLDWVLKTSFGDGYRAPFAAMVKWTNGILGDYDDGIARASNSPFENVLCAAAEALAARVLRETDPDLAAYSLRKAREDWKFGVAAVGNPERPDSGQSRGGSIDLIAAAVLASLDLYRATGEQQYSLKAVELGNFLLRFQQRSYLPALTLPLTGFFYANPQKTRILHYEHRGHEQMPAVALSGLCEAFPDHKDWMQWYSAVTVYSEYYLKAMSAFTEPYGILPASIYGDEEYLNAPADRRESYRQQVLNGIVAGKGYHLRLFPVWFERRGTHGTGLSQTKALSAAAQLRGRLDLSSLAQRELQWVVGRNPFAQSTIYGVGYDYAPQYSESSGDIVGSFPVGIQTREDNDVPYWPAASCYNYKEIWVHPAARWLFAMRDLAGPALVTGQVQPGYDKPVAFREARSGDVLEVTPDPASGTFHATLPEGEYQVRAGGQTKTITVLPGGTYALDLRPGHYLELTLSKETRADGGVTLRIVAQGSGRHRLSVRADNLALIDPNRELDLVSGKSQTIVIRGNMPQTDTPWVAVFIPDGDLAQRHELTGTTRDKSN